MRASALVDTGPIVALVDPDDRWHPACVSQFEALRLPLATSAAVLAEVFHLVGDDRRAVTAAWGLVRSPAFTVLPIADSDMAAVQLLMDRYRDRPMDFADATLVHLAERESLTTVFTIDHDDFETYRIHRRRRFDVVPSRSDRR